MRTSPTESGDYGGWGEQRRKPPADEGKTAVVPLVRTPFTEGLGEVSPDGRWLAYQSNESGREEIYVRPFPDVHSGRWQVSAKGGSKPVWARSSRELFYVDAAGAMTAVEIESAPTFTARSPVTLFTTQYSSATQARSYDVAADNGRFLMIKNAPSERATTAADQPGSMVIVLNWLEELKRLVP